MQPLSRSSTLPQLFEAQVGQTPSAVALIFNDLRLTYAQLNRQANRLARVLVDDGIGPGAIVAVAATRAPQTIVAMLAVLKCGAAYLPLDPEHPRERLTFMLDDARPATILATSDVLTQPDLGWPRIRLDDTRMVAAMAKRHDTDLGSAETLGPVHSSDVAYVIYTSGSTGRPKGVAVSHTGIPYLASSQVARFRVTPQSRILQFAPLSFDASVSEICMALLSGAALVIASPKRLHPGKALAGLVREMGVTHLTLPPSALAAMPAASLASVETLVVAGESCPPALVAQWSVGRRMINAYGPTETTVCATMSEPLSGAVAPPLGTPVEGTAVYVLDPSMRECAPDVAGELHVAGPTLALGYLGRPDLTAQSFVDNPFGPPGSRLYRTGDMAVRRGDGSLHFLRRRDDQVKIRGFRVEPGEVEHVLLHHPAIAQASVVAGPGPGGDLQLTGHVSLIPGASEDNSSMRRYVAARLPQYMVPARIEILDALPVTRHGKVDRTALPASSSGTGVGARNAAPPTSLAREEAELGALYAAVLGLERVSPHDSFFELGGHSLAAVRLVTEIHQVLQVEVELDEVYEFPTVAALNKLITTRGGPSTPSPDPLDGGSLRPRSLHLVPLAGSGADHVFCIHAVDGGVSQYRELARQLAPEVTVHGVTAIDLERRALPPSSLHAIAASYIDQVQQLQPSGPYHLVGWSSGGLLAYEMACQLAAQGLKVGSVTVLDSWRPASQRPWRRYDTVDASGWTAGERNAQWHFFLTKFLPHFHALEVADPEHEFWPVFNGLGNQDKYDAVRTLVHEAVPAAPRLSADELAYVFDVILRQDTAVATYQAARYNGEIDLYVTDFESRRTDTLAYWESMHPGVIHSRHLPGDHAAVVELPGVARVARTIMEHVRSAVVLCVPKTPSTSCDQAIFVDQATDASLSSDAVPRKIHRLW
jgi:pristinamycin I synthase 3 and 4